MNLNQSINKILNEWQSEIKKPFAENQLARFIRREFVSLINEKVNKNEKVYKIKASAGTSKWASVPWLSILDPQITETTQDGVYPVYLFRADGSGVYISLNQGTTIPTNTYGKKEAIKRALNITKYYYSKIDKLRSWDNKPLDLRSNTSLGKSYEKPNIASKFYAKGSIPSEKILTQDLTELLTIYNEVIELWPEFEMQNKSKLKDSNNIDRFFNLENNFSIKNFTLSLKNSGLIYSEALTTRYIASLTTKPFVLLSGLSGSGKTKLAQSFAQWICEDSTQYKIVPVGADWINREPLLGYVNALDNNEYILPENGALELIIAANDNQDKPYFLILDEMNLSHVERYFTDFLSVMESKENFKLHSSTSPLKGQSDILIKKEYEWPKNLFVVGTVNIDETTYMFSPKVLDRANVIEFRLSHDDISNYLGERTAVQDLDGEGANMAESFINIAVDDEKAENTLLNDTLIAFFKELQKVGAEFGYRTASEIQTLFSKISRVNSDYDDKVNKKIDIAIMQKLLPKLHGSRRKLLKVLTVLANLCLANAQVNLFNESGEHSIDDKDIKYKLSFDKIARMYKNAIDNGFASYAEA